MAFISSKPIKPTHSKSCKLIATESLKMRDAEEWDCFYENQAASLEIAPCPSIDAIQNVFVLAVKRDPEIKEYNTLALWDLHYVKEVDDSGYIRQLYR